MDSMGDYNGYDSSSYQNNNVGSSNNAGGGGFHAITGWDTPKIDVKQNKEKNWLGFEVTTSVTVTTMFNGEITTTTTAVAGALGNAFAEATRSYAKAFSALGSIYGEAKRAGGLIYGGLKGAFYNQALRDGVAFGFKTAGLIKLGATAFVGAKAYAITDVLTGGSLTMALGAWAGTPQGQAMINEFAPSMFPGMPTTVTPHGWLGDRTGSLLGLDKL